MFHVPHNWIEIEFDPWHTWRSRKRAIDWNYFSHLLIVIEYWSVSMRCVRKFVPFWLLLDIVHQLPLHLEPTVRILLSAITSPERTRLQCRTNFFQNTAFHRRNAVVVSPSFAAYHLPLFCAMTYNLNVRVLSWFIALHQSTKCSRHHFPYGINCW